MAITAVTPGSGAVVSTRYVLLTAKATGPGWVNNPPTTGIFILGSGRIERLGTWNATAQQWEYLWDTELSPSGPGGNPPEPEWNYCTAFRVRFEGGNRVEEYEGHYFYVMTHDDPDPATTFTWRDANAWKTPFSSFANGNGDAMKSYYTTQGGNAYGAYFVSISTINGRKWATLRPDPSKIPANSDQPTASGIRAQFQTKRIIKKGDYIAWSIVVMIPVGNAVPAGQEQHVNALQFYGPVTSDANPDVADYSQGTPFALNMNIRSKIDGSRLASDRGLFFTTGSKLNPGLIRPLLQRYLQPGKPYTIAGEFGVSSDPRYGWVRLYIDEGSGLKPVRQPIPYPGTDDYTAAPFVLQSDLHRDQRMDIQAYGNLESDPDELPPIWPNFAYQFAHHQIGPSIAAVDPGLYPTNPSMPSGYRVAAGSGVKRVLSSGVMVTAGGTT